MNTEEYKKNSLMFLKAAYAFFLITAGFFGIILVFLILRGQTVYISSKVYSYALFLYYLLYIASNFTVMSVIIGFVCFIFSVIFRLSSMKSKELPDDVKKEVLDSD